MVDYVVNLPDRFKDITHGRTFLSFPDCRIHSLYNFQPCYMQCVKTGYGTGSLQVAVEICAEHVKNWELLLGRENGQVVFVTQRSCDTPQITSV